MPTQEGAPRT